VTLEVGQVVHAVVDRVVHFGVFLTADGGEKVLVLAPDTGVSHDNLEGEFPRGCSVRVKILRYNDVDDVYRGESITRTAVARHKIAIQTGATAFFAEVAVDLERGANLGPVPEQWRAAATAGVHWACRLASSPTSVTVTDILGIHTDTNTALVAIAAARATWKLLGTRVPASLERQLDCAIRDSWNRSPDEPVGPLLERIAEAAETP